MFRLSLFKVGSWTEKSVFEVLDDKAIDTFYHQTEKKKYNHILEKNWIHQRGLFGEWKIYPILAHKTRLVGFIMEIVLWAYPLVQQGKSGVVYLQYTFISEGVLVWFCHKWCYNIVSSDQSHFLEEKLIFGSMFSTATL